MRRTLGVCVVLLFAILLLPSDSFGQQVGERTKTRLGQNYPNPFNPETRIPYEIFEEDLVGGKPAVVTIRIRNLLGQVVAVPLALNHEEGRVAVENLPHATAGSKEAYWDGLDRYGNKVHSGIYLLELVINGERAPTRKMVVAK